MSAVNNLLLCALCVKRLDLILPTLYRDLMRKRLNRHIHTVNLRLSMIAALYHIEYMNRSTLSAQQWFTIQ